MPERIVTDERERRMLIKLIEGQKLPFTATVTRGKHRTYLQNRLQRMWCNEVSEQLGDQTPEEVRGYCKLRMGVPILRAENESFCAKYDAIIRPLTYEQKLECMMEPLDFPITRLMDTSQKGRYLDEIYRHFTEQGVILTVPPDKRFGPARGETEKQGGTA
jgi:hypothetical protein